MHVLNHLVFIDFIVITIDSIECTIVCVQWFTAYYVFHS